MNVKAEELSTGEVNVTFSTTVLVKGWDDSAKLVYELKQAIAMLEVTRT
jgi:hypothetical protein